MKLAPVTLADAHVRLVPFDAGAHAGPLRQMAEGAPEQFLLWSHRGPGDWIGRWLDNIAQRAVAGTMIPFAVLSPDGADYLGITSYLDPSAVNRGVEIGMTAYAPHAAGTVQEGVLRDNRILPNGTTRSTVVFSILAREWPDVKARLDARLAAFG